MIYIIQTNHSLDVLGTECDFQSFVFKFEGDRSSKEDWECFKSYLLNGRKSKYIKKSTVSGEIIRENIKPVHVIINDDYHLSVLYKEGEKRYIKSEYYLITEEVFNRFKS